MNRRVILIMLFLIISVILFGCVSSDKAVQEAVVAIQTTKGIAVALTETVQPPDNKETDEGVDLVQVTAFDSEKCVPGETYFDAEAMRTPSFWILSK